MPSFDIKQAAVMAVLGASFAWLGPHASDLPTPTRSAPPSQPRATRGEPDRAIAIEPLHDWHPRAVEPLVRPRNLFSFATPPVRASAIAHAAPTEDATPEPPPPPEPPPFKMIGIAEDTGPSGPTRRAIISGAGELFVVGEGDPVTPRYRVAVVAPTGVELSDLATGAVVRLTLR
jgi:hypothetical protein